MSERDVPAERERDEHVERVTNALEEAMAQHGLAFEPVDDAAEVGATLAALLAPQEAPAEGISLSAQLSQAAAWMRVWDECQRLGMDTYGAPSTRTGLDIVLDFIRGHAAPQEAREPEAESLVAALRAIIDMEPEPYAFPDDWQAQIAACEECKRWKNHPIQQGICDTHRQPLWDREAHYKEEQRRLHWRMRSIAREALDAHVLAAARPAPETRDPELLGYVVERQLTTGEWMRVWRGRTMWFDHDEAVLDRDAYALDGIPAHIRPVYLGAPAPAEATERSES